MEVLLVVDAKMTEIHLIFLKRIALQISACLPYLENISYFDVVVKLGLSFHYSGLFLQNRTC